MLTLPDVTAVISHILPEPHAGLLSGILFGVKTSLSPELKNALQITGTLHIIALSGMNITILVSLFFSTFIQFLPRWVASILTVGVIALFVWFVGSSPSVIRAAIMGCITLLAPLTGRVSIALVTWAIASGSMLLFHPAWISDISYQLSVLASLGMILFSRTTINGQNKLIQTIQKELTTTLSAQVFTLPLIFVVFGRISLISPITNLLIGWTIPVITVLGLLLSFVGIFWLPLAYPIAWVSWVFLEFLIKVVMITSQIPLASIGR